MHVTVVIHIIYVSCLFIVYSTSCCFTSKLCPQFLQDTGDFQKAEQVLNKVVQIEPDNPLGHFSLGSVPTECYM